jgi:DNA-directed RNA polymerase I and III subunit RPAC2
MPPKKKAATAVPFQEEDVSMAEGSPAPADVPEPENDIELDGQRIRIVSFAASARFYIMHANQKFQLPGASDTAASFEFQKEDHTLGNALRYIIMKK